MNWDNLLSGMIGSVVGAAATVWATQKTIQGTVDTNTALLEKQQTEEQAALWRGMLVEARENLKTLTAPVPQGFQIKVRLVVDFWDRARSHVYAVPRQLQDDLIQTYTMIAQHNELILYDRQALDYGMGTVNDPINKLQAAIKTSLEKLIPELEGLPRQHD